MKANSFNQLRDKDLKITQLQDTLEMKNEEYLKILREREKEKEQQSVFPPSNSKINTSNPQLIDHTSLRPVITNKPDDNLAIVKSEEKAEGKR